MKRLSALCIAGVLLLAKPAWPQVVAGSEFFVLLGMTSAKNTCISTHSELSESISTAFADLVARSTKYFSREQWLQLEKTAATLPSRHIPSHTECAKLATELQGFDVDAVIESAREESACHEELRSATEHNGTMRPAIGIALVEGSRDARVDLVDSNSPAAVAGLMAGDLIVEFATRPVRSACRLAVAVLKSEAGKPASIVVSRGAQILRLTVTPQNVLNE